MKRPPHTCGPISFRFRRQGTKLDKVGVSQLKCDVEKCNRSATWIGSVMGWEIGLYCTGHRDEMLQVARDVLEPTPTPDVEVAA